MNIGDEHKSQLLVQLNSPLLHIRPLLRHALSNLRQDFFLETSNNSIDKIVIEFYYQLSVPGVHSTAAFCK